MDSFTVTGLDTTVVYYFALRALDEANNASPVSNNAKWTPTGTMRLSKVIPAFKDNTIYAESDTLSNALGEHVFVGTNNNQPAARRALMAFAIADSLPAGAVIDSVSLRLYMTKKTPGAGDADVTLRRLSNDWGEGTSIANLGPGEGGGGSVTTGDATWYHRFYDTQLWSTPGGDYFVAGAYPTVTTSAVDAAYIFRSSQMTLDVQDWLDSPAGNFGWILIGDESTARTARQFDSRENSTPANRPQLTVWYSVNP